VNTMPYIQLTGRTPGETIWIRIWDYLGNNTGTFSIRASTPVSLPIELVSFTGYGSGVNNNLIWETATESNNDYFTVEKTIDGQSFEILGNVTGAGNSTHLNKYSLVDYKVNRIVNYYRLKQTDFDGNHKYSDLISIDNTKINKEISSITNLLGQEVNENYRGIVIINYADGSIEKTIK